MQNNRLTSIYTTELENCKSTLKVLNLSHNNLQNIQAVAQCTNLKELQVSDNQISDNILTASISSLRKLRKLDVSGNQLKNGFKLTDAIHHLKGLKLLKLSNNQIVSQLRIDIGRHNRLREVHASHNLIESFILERQSQSRSESQLKVLNLSNNKISYFEGLQYASVSLIELNLSNNNLELVSFAD